jgi:hypothetical protein
MYLQSLCSCILCMFYSQLCCILIVARLFSSVVIYFVHSIWFLSLIVCTTKECRMTLTADFRVLYKVSLDMFM